MNSGYNSVIHGVLDEVETAMCTSTSTWVMVVEVDSWKLSLNDKNLKNLSGVDLFPIDHFGCPTSYLQLQSVSHRFDTH